MGNLKKWIGLSVVLAACVTVGWFFLDSFFDYTKEQKNCAAQAPSMDIDHIGVMNSETEVALRDLDYTPNGICGLSTASFSSFPIMIGSCRGTISIDRNSSAPPYSINIRTGQASDGLSTVNASEVEQFPNAADLIATNVHYKNC